MLYDVNFIIGLLITIVLVTVVAFYFSQRIEEQTEKISAVSVVVQAIAGELHELKYRFNGGNVTVSPSMQGPSIELSECNNVDLIPVSDDEGSEYDGDDDPHENVKSIHIGGTCENDIILNEVESDDSESGSESDSESESESGSESSGSDSEPEEGRSDEPHDIEEMDLQNICNEIEVPEEDICATLNILEELDELGELNIDVEENVKTVNVSLEEEVVDYKKMSLSKLRSIVVEKHLSQDASKMKKGEIFKLLGVEQ